MKLRTISVPVYNPGEPPRNHTAAAMDSAVTGALVRAWKAAGGEVPEAGTDAAKEYLAVPGGAAQGGPSQDTAR
jgi:hypothetical protein